MSPAEVLPAKVQPAGKEHEEQGLQGRLGVRESSEGCCPGFYPPGPSSRRALTSGRGRMVMVNWL